MDTTPMPPTPVTAPIAVAPVAPAGDVAAYIAYLEQRVSALEARLPDTKLLSPRFMTRAWAVWGHYFVAQLILTLIIWGITFVVFFVFSFLFGAGLAAILSRVPAN